MQVAIVTSCFLDRDGLGNSLRDLAATMEALGHEVDIYVEADEGTTIEGFSCQPLTLAELLESSAAGKKHSFFDHELFIVSYLAYYPLMEVCRFLPRGRLLIEYPGVTPAQLYPDHDPLGKVVDKANRHLSLLDCADCVFVHSEYMKKELLSLHSIPEEKLFVLPLMVDSRYKPQNIKRKSHSLLYVGRLTANKRVDLLLSALALLKDKFPNLSLEIATMLSRSTSSHYKSELDQIIALHELKNVHFHDGLSNEELVAQYGLATLFVTASVHEGFCLPVAEAMACGLPCVVFDETATPETMGQGGVAVKAQSAESLAAALEMLLSDEEKRKSLADKALFEAKRFSAQSFKDNVKKLLQNVMGKRPLAQERAEGAFRLIEAASTTQARYHDKLRWPLVGPMLRWLRRKATLPLEVSCLRPMSQQQTLWNKLMVEQMRQLRQEVQRLRAELERREHNDKESS